MYGFGGSGKSDKNSSGGGYSVFGGGSVGGGGGWSFGQGGGSSYSGGGGGGGLWNSNTDWSGKAAGPGGLFGDYSYSDIDTWSRTGSFPGKETYRGIGPENQVYSQFYPNTQLIANKFMPIDAAAKEAYMNAALRGDSRLYTRPENMQEGPELDRQLREHMRRENINSPTAMFDALKDNPSRATKEDVTGKFWNASKAGGTATRFDYLSNTYGPKLFKMIFGMPVGAAAGAAGTALTGNPLVGMAASMGARALTSKLVDNAATDYNYRKSQLEAQGLSGAELRAALRPDYNPVISGPGGSDRIQTGSMQPQSPGMLSMEGVSADAPAYSGMSAMPDASNFISADRIANMRKKLSDARTSGLKGSRYA